MFTGLVEALGRVGAVEDGAEAGGGSRVVGAGRAGAGGSSSGESVAVSGVCLTVVDAAAGTARVRPRGGDPARDDPGRARGRGSGEPRAAAPARRAARRAPGPGPRRRRRAGHRRSARRATARGSTSRSRAGLRPLLIPKGSVTVDGVSLTVAGLEESVFAVALIPHTLAVTTLGQRRAGDPVNLEMDVIGKYVRGFDGRSGSGRDAARRDVMTRACERPASRRSRRRSTISARAG